jgi:hypothetical protein
LSSSRSIPKEEVDVFDFVKFTEKQEKLKHGDVLKRERQWHQSNAVSSSTKKSIIKKQSRMTTKKRNMFNNNNINNSSSSGAKRWFGKKLSLKIDVVDPAQSFIQLKRSLFRYRSYIHARHQGNHKQCRVLAREATVEFFESKTDELLSANAELFSSFLSIRRREL